MVAVLTRPPPLWRLTFVAALLLAAVSIRPALAIYPGKIVRIVVPFAPGGGTNVVARTLAHDMEGDLGKSVMIENKPGGEDDRRNASRRHQQAGRLHAVDGNVCERGQSQPEREAGRTTRTRILPPLRSIARSFNIVVVNPKSPVRTIADLIAAAKANPGKLTFGTFGAGTSAHLAGELFKNMARVNTPAVPYKGAAPGITDLIGGQIDVMFTTVASAASLVESGQLRAIAVTSAERSPAFPQLPTVAEAGVPGYAAESWYGLFAPAGTPKDIIDRINKSAALAVQSEAFKKLGVNEGLVMVMLPPEALDRYFHDEEERWRRVIGEAGIKVE